MKRKIIMVLLLAAYLPILYAEGFYNKDDYITINYTTNHVRQDKIQELQSLLMVPMFGFSPLGYISKLSNRDKELINEALSRFEVKETEVYLIKICFGLKRSIGFATVPASKFLVIITDVNKRNYQWTAYGVYGAQEPL